jgi:hypothetical protein
MTQRNSKKSKSDYESSVRVTLNYGGCVDESGNCYIVTSTKSVLTKHAANVDYIPVPMSYGVSEDCVTGNYWHRRFHTKSLKFSQLLTVFTQNRSFYTRGF